MICIACPGDTYHYPEEVFFLPERVFYPSIYYLSQVLQDSLGT